jgi:hypothetical protein
MNTIINNLKKFFSKEKLPYTLGIIIIILSILYFKSCNSLRNEKLERKRDEIIYNNNMKALTDSIMTSYNKKLEQYISVKTSFIFDDLKDLKQLNNDLYLKMKAIDNSIGIIDSRVSILGPLIISIGDSLKMKDSNNYEIGWNFNYEEKGFKQTLSGNSPFKLKNNIVTPGKSYLTKNEFEVGITYGFKDLGDRFEVFATSPSSRVKFLELEGALKIDKQLPQPKKVNRLVFGPNVGIGVNSGLNANDLRLGWNVGFSLTYNILPTGGNRDLNKRFRLFKKNSKK